MSIVVNTNISSLVAQNSLNKATNSLNTSLERMSTGYKINKAADDAAGLSIATNINTQVRGSKVAKDNIQQGINVLQTTEGSLTTITDNINRIRDLALQAANGVNSSASRDAIKAEVTARIAEIDKTAAAAEFNGVKLLDGSIDTLRLQVGPNSTAAENSISVTGVFGEAKASSLGITTDADTAFADADAAAAFVEECDTALSALAEKRSAIGAYQNRLNSNLDTLTVGIENMSASYSTIMDADIAEESSNFIKSQILQQASASLLSQANQTPSIALSLI